MDLERLGIVRTFFVIVLVVFAATLFDSTREVFIAIFGFGIGGICEGVCQFLKHEEGWK